MPLKCHAFNCTNPAVAKGLCGTHRKRLERNGHIEQTRAADWGDREKHPAYRAWCGLRRVYKHAMPEDWFNDFWAFARDVPAKPESHGRVSAKRPRPAEPWGPDNFYWQEPRAPADKLQSRAEYMREWQRAARAADPDHGKNKDLLRHYGVTLEWYRAKEAEQNGVCAVCFKPETGVIRGKVLALSVDHCHETGRVRGLLCSDCNRAIGMLHHDEQLLRNAIAYLKEVSELPENPQS